MRHLVFVFVLAISLAFGSACNRRASANSVAAPASASASTRAATAAPPPPAVPPATPPPSASGPKLAPSEGVTAKLGSGKVRVSAIKAGHFRVWIMDERDEVASIQGMTAEVTVALPGYPKVELHPDVDHFEGKGPEMSADHPRVTVVVDKNGKPRRSA